MPPLTLLSVCTHQNNYYGIIKYGIHFSFMYNIDGSSKSVFCIFILAKSSMKLGNLFKDQENLAKVVGEFLNSPDFLKLVMSEIKPALIIDINNLFEEVMNKALSQFAVGEYLDKLGR